MRRWSPAPCSGASLIEMCVCAGLLGLCMLCVAQILAAGTRYFNTANKTTDLQQACLLTATELINEVSESNMGSVYSEPPAGVIFCSPRDQAGKVAFTGPLMIWQKWVAYFTVDDGPNGWHLHRKEEMLNSATPATVAPFVPTDKYLPHFRGSSEPGRQVARYIYDLSVDRTDLLFITIGAQDESGEFRVKVQTKVKTRN